MGSAGSFPKDEADDINSFRRRNLINSSRGIEQQIPVEVKPRKRLGKSRPQANQTTSVQSLSNSFTHNGQGPSSILKKKTTGASLRSVLSNDTVLDLENNVELEKMRREFDNFKLSKQNEIVDMQKREKKLESENKRLRGEVQALQKTCTRLRNERESALENETQALERARAFEDDRNNILSQLRYMQESEAVQVSTNQGASNSNAPGRHDSEHGASDTSSNSPHRNPDQSIDNQNNITVQDSELRLDLASPSSISVAANTSISEDNRPTHSETFKFEASVKPTVSTPPVFVHWPGCHEHVWSTLEFVLGYFEPQLEDDVDLFMDAWCSKYEESLIENHGLKMNCTSKFFVSENLQLSFSTTNVFIIFLESKISESDYKSLQNLVNIVKSSSSLKALFCFKQAEQSSLNSSMNRLKKLLSKVNSSESQYCLFIENYQQMEPLVSLVNESVDQFVTNNFSEGVLGECSCCRDIRGVLYQKDAFASLLENLPSSQQMAAIDNYVFCINRHIVKEGHVPPLVIKSEPGFGKSTVLAHFLRKHRASNPQNKILYHFVDTTKMSQDGTLMMKRFSSALNSVGSYDNSSVICSSSSNEESFSRLLESFPRKNLKFGAQSSLNNMSSYASPLLIISIDSADRLNEAQKILEWVQDPLPPDVRVVISVDQESCPSSWSSMACVQIKPQQAVYTLHLNESQKKKFVELQLSSPYFARILTKVDLTHIPPPIVAKVASNQELGKEVVFKALVSTVAHQANNSVSNIYKILYFISQSYQGICAFWILELWRQFHPSISSQDSKMIKLSLQKLASCRLISLRQGNFVMTSSVTKRLLVSRMHEKDASVVVNFPEKFLIALEAPFQLSDHLPLEVILETLFILRSSEKFSERLRTFIGRVIVFIHLYKFDFTALIMTIYTKLKIEIDAITDLFANELSQIEQKSDFKSIEYLLDIMECFAAFNCQLGLFSKAAHLYERSLEIRELNLDPDHPSCSRTLYLNAHLHFKWDKIDIAETLLKQSIEIIESITPTAESPNIDYVQLVHNFDLLGTIYQRLGKVKQYEANAKKLSYLRSMAFIQNFLGNASSEALNAATIAESTPDSLEKANHLNEYAVLLFYQGNHDDAESSFKVSLAIREKLLGQKHPDCSQSLFNLGGLNFEKKSYSKSSEYFEKAVAIRKQTDNSNNTLLTTVQWLVIAYRKSGNREKALELLKDLVKLNIEAYGPDHQYVATNYANMGSIYCEMKQYKEALPLFENALNIFTTALGPYDDKVSDTLNNMALLKFEMDDLESAVGLYRQAQECKQIGLGLRQTTSTAHLPLTPTHSRHRRLGSDFQSQQSLNSVVE
ncbi:nephrocystin-3-like [Convolutriloba macropyga]|uniref:nephrocystin-3-like n=1 Tax=Convolutriloba macropyga TaxID=536237 RepID=UPI003F51FDE6